jgi:hypothetical protein
MSSILFLAKKIQITKKVYGKFFSCVSYFRGLFGFGSATAVSLILRFALVAGKLAAEKIIIT